MKPLIPSPRGEWTEDEGRPVWKSTIRRLKAGDTIPEGEPRRYVSRLGYVHLRWLVNTGEYVDALEHRVVMGLPPSHLDVHHVNTVRDDNRPQNLLVVTVAEHKRIHAQLQAERIGHPGYLSMADLYRAGATTTELAELYGINPASVSRGLRRAGCEMRPASPRAFAPAEEQAIIDRLRHGGRVRGLATELGVARTTIKRIRDAAGIPSARPGRPKADGS